jgi:hypothetical protein
MTRGLIKQLNLEELREQFEKMYSDGEDDDNDSLKKDSESLPSGSLKNKGLFKQ